MTSPNVMLALRILADSREPLTAEQIGGPIVAAMQARGERGTGQRGSRYIGRAAIASPVLSSLSRRGWASVYPRPDGMSGSAWIITTDGIKALAEMGCGKPDLPHRP